MVNPDNNCDKDEIAEPVINPGIEKENGVDFLGDTPFNVKIIPIQSEAFDIQVSSFELVQELHRVLMDREETCHCTCFSLVLNGQTLDMFAELKNIEGFSDGAEIRAVEDRYSVREAKNHIKHIHDLLSSTELCDAYSGREQMSLSFVNVVAGDVERKASQADLDEYDPPSYVLPNGCMNDALPLLPLHPIERDGKPIRCVRQLNFSNWNPPPASRRLSGDLVYIFVHTMEDKRYHITASPRGFFVNMSTDDEFNPQPIPNAHIAHSLVDLLRFYSPGFKRSFEVLLKRRASKHPFERVTAPYQVFSWLSPSFEHTPDSIRKEEAFSSRMACEENLPGQTRDWNEELQVTRELKQSRLCERLLRDRAVFKSNCDFVAAATRAAVSVINGDIMAINPGESRKQQMFIWNNMFFSLGFDIKDHYKNFGGEYAAYVATSSDLNGVRAYSMLDEPGLHSLGTAVIDYRGYRVTAQTIVPGILEKEQEQLVVYGSADFGKTILSDDKYKELLAKTAKQLKIRPHTVINHQDEEVELFSSIDCKGIVGNDGRAYIIDLLRTFPPDLNYFGSYNVDNQPRPILPDTLTQMGYPFNHRHLLATLRQELVEAYFDHLHERFIGLAICEYQKSVNAGDGTCPLGLTNGTTTADEIDERPAKDAASPLSPNKSTVLSDTELTPAVVPPSLTSASKVAKASSNGSSSDLNYIRDKLASWNSEVNETMLIDSVRKAAEAVGSSSATHFVREFNPDIFQQFVRFADSETEALKSDSQLVYDACEFLVKKQIPAFVHDCLNHFVIPQDGQALVELMHQKGISVRYLHRIIEAVEDRSTLIYLKRLAVVEILVRSAKHVYSGYIQDADPMFMSVAISHFLNCLLTTCPSLAPLNGLEELLPKLSKAKKGKKKTKNVVENSTEEMAWSSVTPSSLWADLIKEANEYYHFDLKASDIENFSSVLGIHRIQILRSFCHAVGIQLHLRDYALSGSKSRSAKSPVFTPEDINSVFPVVKHLHPHATDAYHYFTTGQAKISSGYIQEGFELINEALNLLNAVYGLLHPDVGACNRLLGRLSYVMNEHATALLFQHRATMISERVHGIDSPNTTTEYVHLALYLFAAGRISSALQVLYRARYIALLCHGEEHPEMTQIDTNIGLILQLLGQYSQALLFFESALQTSRLFYGENNLKEAFTCHLISRIYAYQREYRAALEYERRRFNIYSTRLGNDSEYTRESDAFLGQLTQLAVRVAKRAVTDSSSSVTPTGSSDSKVPSWGGKSLKSLLDICSEIPLPNVTSILETLNRVNGVILIQLKPRVVSNSSTDVTTDEAELKPLPSSDDQPSVIQNGQVETVA